MRSAPDKDKVESTRSTTEDTRSDAPTGMTRREVLTTGITAVAAAAAGCSSPPSEPPVNTEPVIGADGVPVSGSLGSIRAEKVVDAPVPESFTPNFFEPEIVRAGRDKAIREDLTVRKAELRILQPDPENPGEWDYRLVSTRTYNGKVPGPTLEVYPGDRLEFSVRNALGPSPPAPPPYEDFTCAQLMALDIPHCFNTTNLHTHGLHVSPSSREDGVASDDITVKIEPDGEQPYLIWLPEFHAPGTHWYHAHVHGSTALQVCNGLAGALIVKEPDDDPAQQVKVDDDIVWMIQEIIGEPSDSVYGKIEDADGNAVYGTAQPEVRFTVNSIDSAELVMGADQIHRWRFINATGTPRGFMNVALEREVDAGREPYTGENKGLNLMAVDGITFYGEPAVPVEEHFMAPGNRADFLVQIPDPGTYYVVKRKAGIRSGGNTGPTRDQDLVKIVVTGAPQEPRALPALPSTDFRPCYLTPISNEEVAEIQREVDFEVDPSFPAQFGAFKINGEAYGSHPPGIDVPYQAVEEWNLTNQSGAAHPFHIHVNPFQVVGELINPNRPDEPSNWRWQDVVSVPPNEGNTPGAIKIRHRFLTYSGKFVIHCHVLVHEDCGMMRDVEVGPGGAGPGEPVEVCVLP